MRRTSDLCLKGFLYAVCCVVLVATGRANLPGQPAGIAAGQAGAHGDR
ncbi:hypothetical protein ACFOET_20940 [Parapedobacter deserti]|uniref:Uncharacterized protein n=1 Tax=Parapedobacter deserti TaxID=1912957 RepID=A0ABV7JPR5_9SPHI